MRLRSRLLVASVIPFLAPFWLCATVSAQERRPKTVVMIHWGPEDFPATPIASDAIRTALTSDPILPVDVFAEYLESDLFPPEDASQGLSDYIRTKYRGRRIDLVIALADPALRFALDHRAELFPDAPIVYSGLAVPNAIDRSAGAGLTAVMRGVAYDQTLRLALQLHPVTERVFVVAKRPDTQVVTAVQDELRTFSERVRLTYLDEETLPGLLSRRQKRWGIDPAMLPPGSDIRFRTPTLRESYRWYIIGTVVVIAAQLLLIAGLLAQHAKRRRAEETVRAREATLRRSYERIRQMAGRLINAQEAARASLARDLHDDVCQQLVYVTLGVSSLKNSSGTIQDPDTQEVFTRLEHETTEMFDGLRRLSHELHPSTLSLLGLAPTLKAHCQEMEKRHNVQVSFRTEGECRQLPPDLAVCLFRIAQEALRNAVVHGDAKRLTVSLVRVGENVELTITDDGRGFDLEAVRRDGSGLGLVSMEERGHAVGAEVEIVSGPRKGTTIRVRGTAGARETAGRDEAAGGAKPAGGASVASPS